MGEILIQLSSPIDRRSLGVIGWGAFAVYALLGEARASGQITDSCLTAKQWLDRQEDLARALSDGSLSPSAWHDEVNRIATEVDVAQLMAEVGRGRATVVGKPFMHDPVKRSVRFVDENGAPREFTYGAALFSFDASNVITPHAHRHMASAHMVVDGQMRIRTFDRVGDREGAIVIQPTGDRVAHVGEAAAMTTAKDNIHWFVPASPKAATFDIIVDSLDPGEKAYVIEPVDPLGGRRQADGTIIAPLLSFEESMKRYPPTV